MRKYIRMRNHPKLRPFLTKGDLIIEFVGILLLVAFWILVLTSYASLPDVIPTHYNGFGVADGFGSKSSILTLPLIATLIFLLISILSRFPYIFNYPTIITEENAVRQYTNATRMLRSLKVGIVLLFEVISLMTILQAKGQTSGLGSWFLPIALVVLMGPVIYYLIQAFKHR